MKYDATSKMKVFSLAVFLIVINAAVALYFGVSDKGLFLSGLFDLLLVALIFALMAANFVYFRKRTASLYPQLSRALPFGSVMAVGLFLFLEKPLFHSNTSPEGIVTIYASLLAAWTILNVAVSLTVKRRA